MLRYIRIKPLRSETSDKLLETEDEEKIWKKKILTACREKGHYI
jgi:hypothetical protein